MSRLRRSWVYAWQSGWKGTTASPWHPAGTVPSRSDVPPSRGRPPEQQRNSAVIPTLPSPHVRGRRERARHTRTPGSCTTGSGPSRGRRANETSSVPIAFRGTCRGRFCGRPKVVHAHEIDLTAVRRRSNNDAVDLDCVDKWLDCVPNLCHSTGDRPVSPEPRRRCCVQLARRLTGNSRQRTAAQPEKWP
jgi:hypothetical protein